MLLTRDKRDGLGVWLWLLGLENPVPVQEEADWARSGLCPQVLVVDIYWYNISTIGKAGYGGEYLLVQCWQGRFWW